MDGLMIRGVPVQFPHARPYGQQLALMDGVLRACSTSSHALLEAPTGTGKSLALLCATLAWLKKEKEAIRAPALDEAEEDTKVSTLLVQDATTAAVEPVPVNLLEESDSDSGDFKRALKRGKMTPRSGPVPSASPSEPAAPEPAKKQPKLPRIFIASRTHSQLSQLVRELKKTSYRPRMVVLGSREQYCVNPKVAHLSSGGAKNAACKRLLQEKAAGGCGYKHAKSRVYSHPALAGVWDVEDMVAVGRQVHGCPYFASRNMATTAELVFCPYNYILEPAIRKSLGISLKNAVIVFDEAHNIEGIAAETASFECELGALVGAMEELMRIADTSDKSQRLLSALQRFVAAIRAFAELKSHNEDIVWGGREILALLDGAQITTETFKELHGTYSDLLATAEDKEEAAAVGLVQDHRQAKTLSSAADMALSGLFSTLQFMLCADMRFLNDYRAVISRGEERGAGPGAAKAVVTRLHLWCLSSAAAFQQIKEEARCVILASGTLAPMDSFSSELGMQFPIRLETHHVVDTARQLWAAAVPNDPSGSLVFNWSFKNTENVRLQDALGAAVSQICHVTPGGVLVFFSSYNVLNKVLLRWKSTGFLNGQLVPQKCVLVEPSGPIDDVIAVYYRANGDDSKVKKSAKSSKFKKPVLSEGEVLPTQTGGLLLAVCRGKVSEGIDFADQHCRAVVIVGLPFPNTRDLQLRLKKEDHETKSRTTPGVLNGGAWYSLQAFRALNQAIGRCIRHMNDYGAIILLDERFMEKRTVESVSKWIRPVISNQPNFAAAMESLAAFFERNASPPTAVAAAAVLVAGKRWCCCTCARPVAFSASPSSFQSSKTHMLEIAAALGPPAAETAVLVFDAASLNPDTLRRSEQAFYCQADGIAYSDLSCVCTTRVGAILEAGNADNVDKIGACWIVAAATLKL